MVSKSGNKSIKVAIDYVYRHPKYGKTLRRQTRLIVHDERNEAGVGDVVEIDRMQAVQQNQKTGVLSKF